MRLIETVTLLKAAKLEETFLIQCWRQGERDELMNFPYNLQTINPVIFCYSLEEEQVGGQRLGVLLS